MDRQELSRRDLLGTGATVAAGAIAGCTLPRSEAATTGKQLLTFDGVGRSLQERCEAVYGHVEELVGASIQAETTIKLIDTAAMRELAAGSGFIGDTTTQRLAHRALGLVETVEPDLSFEFAGAYFPGSETILLVGDEPSVDDQLIAHELCHAIQFQTNVIDEWDRTWAAGFDRYNAKQALIEGTAQFLEDEYVGGCDGHFSNCHLKRSGRIQLDQVDPALLVAFGAYINGHDFAAALAERNGWNAVWDAHADPPTTTGEILHPDWYPNHEPAQVPVPDEPEPDWSTLDDERLGMQSVFLTLWNEGVLPTEEVASDDEVTDEVFSTQVRYRSPISDAWRGDRFTTFVREGGRHAWLWRIRWRDSSAAETGYEYFREWADLRGERTSDGTVWERDDRYETLSLDGRDLLVGMAPDVAAFESIDPALLE